MQRAATLDDRTADADDDAAAAQAAHAVQVALDRRDNGGDGADPDAAAERWAW